MIDMKRMRTIEQHFILKPNPYVTEEQANSALWKLAVSEVSMLSSVAFVGVSFWRGGPKIFRSSAWRNVGYLQGVIGVGMLYWHMRQLKEVAEGIPASEIQHKMSQSQ